MDFALRISIHTNQNRVVRCPSESSANHLFLDFRFMADPGRIPSMLAAVCFSSDYFHIGQPVNGNLLPTARRNGMGYGPSIPKTTCIAHYYHLFMCGLKDQQHA